MASAAHQPRVALGAENPVECGGDSRVGGLEAKLVDGHPPHVDRWVVERERHDQFDDVEPERLGLAPVAAEGMNGMSTHPCR